MSDFRARLFEEFNQLSQRIQKLRDFIISDKFDDLAEIDRKDLKEQLKHMQGYYDVLSRRSCRLCGDA